MTIQRTIIGLTAAAALAAGLCGCTSGTSTEVVYAAWTDGGTVASVRYSYIDGPNGALSVPVKPDAPSWTVTRDGGHNPSVTVTPSPGGIAHCALIRPDQRVLAAKTGAVGAKVSCEWRAR